MEELSARIWATNLGHRQSEHSTFGFKAWFAARLATEDGALFGPQRRTDSAPCVPHREYPDLFFARHVVDVIASPAQKNATGPSDRRRSIRPTDLWSVTDHVEGRGQLVGEEVGSRGTVFAPPDVDYEDL